MLDRFDFQLFLQSVHLSHQETNEDSNTIRQRVTNARNQQKKRYHHPSFLNSTVPSDQLIQLCGITKQQLDQLAVTCFHEKWSNNRTQLKIIRIARTITDLAGTKDITDTAIDEAISWKKHLKHNSQIHPNHTKSP
ncbi:hypothetical protein [Rummeliibacillus suwonensis]|uniref:magnesium chelatase subunit ChlI family protein n=1 Tax=Rummeliibacillus suwonensis TaxID=1306154 RepID=UPI001FD5E9B2|nr:hypothetical protein [Rummeliibacillus suwonensis]